VLGSSASQKAYCLHTRKPPWLWRAQMCTVLLIGILISAVGAAERGSISGRIRQGEQGIAAHRIMLIRFGPNQEVHRTPGQTDTEGRFTFRDLETGDAYTYVVGIRYAGQLYRSVSVRLAAGEHRTGVLVEAGEGATQTPETSQPSVHIEQHLIVVVFRGDDRLGIREIVRMRNPGTEPATGKGTGAGGVLYFPLPRGYGELEDLQGLEPQHVQLRPSGMYYTAPLAPGEHNIVYTYTLPFRDRVTTLVLERALPTRVLDILVEDSQLVGTSNLQFGGQEVIQPHTFLHFRGTGLTPQSQVWLQLTRRNDSAPALRFAAYGLIVGIVLLGIGYTTWRGSKRPVSAALTPERLGELQAARVRLLRTVAHLDDAYAAGRLDVQDYKRQRQHAKQQLLDLTEQLYHAEQTAAGVEPTARRQS
jgi:hypothetical protein